MSTVARTTTRAAPLPGHERLAPGPALLFIVTSSILLWLGLGWGLRLLLS